MSILKEKEKLSTRDKILETAIELFANKGFSGTTTKEIADEASVNEALIFRHFSTKSDLYAAIIEKKIQEEPDMLIPLKKFNETGDDREVFKSLAIRIFENCGADTTFLRLLHFSALEGHELSEMFFDTYVDYVNMLLFDYIQTRIKDGAFKDIDPLLSAKAFIGMVINFIIVQELFGQKKRKKANTNKVVETFVTLFLEGIKK
ncbi:MAG: TetR/AcrR family transcriptional regulator [Thermodesulfobacteriota bacterium]